MSNNKNRIEITELGLPKVLAALANYTDPLGMGKLDPKAFKIIDEVDCELVLQEYGFDNKFVENSSSVRFDYVFGRPIKTGFTRDVDGKLYVDGTFLYNRDSARSAENVIKDLKTRLHLESTNG